jgi:hypothetical protein
VTILHTECGTNPVHDFVHCEGVFYTWRSGQVSKASAENEQFEEAYQNIGWWKGPRSPEQVRVENEKFWAETGPKGARWLVNRLRQEHNIEVLHAAASLLASLGTIVLGPILDALDGTAVGDDGLALLGALSKLGPSDGRTCQTRLLNTVGRYLRHPLPELREAAAAATAILPYKRAIRLLQDVLRTETSAVVREAIQGAIAERQEEQD